MYCHLDGIKKIYMETRIYYILFFIIILIMPVWVDGKRNQEENLWINSNPIHSKYDPSSTQPLNETSPNAKNDFQRKDTVQKEIHSKNNKQWLYNGSFIPLQ